jgi:RNA polymerase sigma factor (sigma-70 family)
MDDVLGRIRSIAGASVYVPLTDGELLDRFARQHDDGAFAELLHRHGPMVLALCRGVLRDTHQAADAFQATFLVLVQKAGSIRDAATLGNWLYGVARRVATRTRAGNNRRSSQELLCAEIAEQPGEPGWSEVFPIIDEEIARLPSKYRKPVVLCYLEGKTNDEAARLLNWPPGTVKGRMSRARDMLRARLLRRGVAPVVAAGCLEQTLHAAPVPPQLIGAATTAARHLADGGSWASIPVSPQVSCLVKGVLFSMSLTRLKLISVLALSVLVGLGACGLAIRSLDRFGNTAAVLDSSALHAAVVDPTGELRSGGANLALPEGVTTDQGSVGYFANASGGIDAVEFTSGKVVWTTQEAQLPLVAFGDQVAAQVYVKDKPALLRVVLLDVRDKGKISKQFETSFKEPVKDQSGYRFSIHGTVIKDELVLEWQSRYLQGGGPPPPRGRAVRNRTSQGAVRIDLRTAKITEQPKPALTSPQRPDALKAVRLREYWTGSEWRSDPLVVGKKTAVVARQKENAFVLQTWDSGSDALDTPVVLFKYDNSLFPQLTTDRRHLAVHKGLPKEGLGEEDYAWWIFSLETGKLVGKISYEEDTRALAVVGDKVLYMTEDTETRAGEEKPVYPHRLTGVDLKTRKILWRRNVRGQYNFGEDRVP